MLFTKYLGWVLIPNFIVFAPIGLIWIFKNRDFNKTTIIVSMAMMSIPAFYAYTIPALDTRYLYVLFPMFAVLSALTIEKISQKLNRTNVLTMVIIAGIIVSSILFYPQRRIDYEHEREVFEITDRIYPEINGVNELRPESSSFVAAQTIRQWPNEFTALGESKVSTIPTDGYTSVDGFIAESKNSGLTHIMADDKMNRNDFLIDIYQNETKYPYLEKVYDSKSDRFDYHVKLFKIDYQIFDSLYNYPSIDAKR